MLKVKKKKAFTYKNTIKNRKISDVHNVFKMKLNINYSSPVNPNQLTGWETNTPLYSEHFY